MFSFFLWIELFWFQWLLRRVFWGFLCMKCFIFVCGSIVSLYYIPIFLFCLLFIGLIFVLKFLNKSLLILFEIIDRHVVGIWEEHVGLHSDRDVLIPNCLRGFTKFRPRLLRRFFYVWSEVLLHLWPRYFFQEVRVTMLHEEICKFVFII